ncbi:hypothetical protein ANSO36C_59020 [Nostoc cf. commune SO-36]|uniref:Prolyl aminopeptidase n=1 Tax=Nostoc cf. commune SO-36 TaxID=449208 RepID=A0ABM7ZA39_NOSCO|nr:hypothetical protein ANSO36C_59020 [Nostoc cf. commune SO-36]
MGETKINIFRNQNSILSRKWRKVFRIQNSEFRILTPGLFDLTSDRHDNITDKISKMRELYPAIQPYLEGSLKVSDLHTIHFEESGNPQGKPIVLLHGGPGGGCPAFYRQIFSPRKMAVSHV